MQKLRPSDKKSLKNLIHSMLKWKESSMKSKALF